MNYDNQDTTKFNNSEATSTAQTPQPAQRKARLTDQQKIDKLRDDLARLEQKVSKEKTQKKILLGSALMNYVKDETASNPNPKERVELVLRIIDQYITRDIDRQRLDDFVNELNDKINPKPAETKDAETENTDNKDADSDTEKETVSNA